MHRFTRFAASLVFVLAGPAVRAQETAFVHVNVVPMDRQGELRDQTVVVRDGRIVAVGRTVPVPPGARRVEGHGRLWLSPGLADLHVHSDTRDDLATYLTYGVTTIVNMGDARSGFVGRTAPAATRGDLPGPRVFIAFVVDGSPEYGHFTVTTPAEARAAVGLAKTNGYHLIKVYNNLAADVFAALADEARRRGMPVVGHGVTKVGLAAQIAQGQALVAHLEEFFYTYFTPPGGEQTDAPPADARIVDAVAVVRAHGVAVGADLVTYGGIVRVIGRPDVVAACLAAPSARLVAPADRLAWRRSSYVRKTADLRARYAFLGRMAKAMADADVELVAGTDAPTVPCVGPGASLHDNLTELRRAGLSGYQALATATRNAGAFLARTLGAPLSGVIVPGARADLVLGEGSPLDDVATLRRPVGVMVGGRWHDASALDRLRADVAAAYIDR